MALLSVAGRFFASSPADSEPVFGVENDRFSTP